MKGIFKGSILVVGCLLFLLLVSGGISTIGYQRIQTIYANQIADIVGKVVTAYPQSESLLAKSLKSLEEYDVAVGKQILEKYGYTSKEIQPRYSQEGFKTIWKWNVILVSLVVGVIGIAVYRLYRYYESRLRALQNYLVEIANGNYSLNIEGVGEGKFSRLEDEIYKTTIALRESKEAQEKEKLNLAKNLADISHQLKTPLASMGIMTELLLQSEVSEQNRQFMKQLEKQIERLSHLVSVLLKLAKFDSGTVKLKEEVIEVQSFVEEIIDILEVPICQKKLQVILQGKKQDYFIGDRSWTYEAFYNVINNCIEYSKEEGKLKISWSHNPMYTEIVVQDEGGRISEKDLPHIFTRFYKGQNASKESFGIGLAMAKAILEKQDGEIGVQNIDGGVRFHIKFYHTHGKDCHLNVI